MGHPSNGHGAARGAARSGLSATIAALAALTLTPLTLAYAEDQAPQPAASAPAVTASPEASPAVVSSTPLTSTEPPPAPEPVLPPAPAPASAGERAQSSAPPPSVAPSTPPAAAIAKKDPDKLRITVSPGAYALAQRKVVFPVLADRGGAAIVEVPWPEGGPLSAAAEGSWDVAEVDSAEAVAACQAGRLQKLDAGRLVKSPDGSPAERDFLAGSLSECGVGSAAWSSLILFDRRAWPARPQTASKASKRAKPPPEARLPETLADVFDAKTFPGMRALRKEPMHLLEMALLADGVAAEQVYAVLASDEGAARAFNRLETLRGHIVWAETPTQATRLLSDRKAVMASVYSGRAFQMAAVEGKPYGLIWDGQIYRINMWVVARGATDGEKAAAFVALATDPGRQAAIAREFPYGPVRASAVGQVGRHPILRTELAPFLPTAPASLRTALQLDAGFWRTHGDRLRERFEAWLKAPLPGALVPQVAQPSPSGASPTDAAAGNASAIEPRKPARTAPAGKSGRPI